MFVGVLEAAWLSVIPGHGVGSHPIQILDRFLCDEHSRTGLR